MSKVNSNERTYGQIKGDAAMDICRYVLNKYGDIPLVARRKYIESALGVLSYAIRLNRAECEREVYEPHKK